MQAQIGNILLVEDEDALREALKLNLELEGYSVTTAANGNAALKAFKEEFFNLIILDVMLPEMDGITVCETIRLHNAKVPILFLSAKSSGADRVLGLKKGGDDYITKPFNLEELLLRIKKILEKQQLLEEGKTTAPQIVEIGKSKIDFTAQECVDINGNKHQLTKKEIMLLKLLIENKGEVITREFILKTVWGYNVYPSTRTIDNFILTFRKYFESDSRNPLYFHSIRGLGYKFTDAE